MPNGYSTLLTLGGTELTIHGRTFEETRDERSTEVVLANGRSRKYIKYIGKSWQLKWTWLPDDASTVDGCAGRNGIKTLASTGTEKTLVVYSLDSSNVSFTVFVVDYNESLIRREAISGRSFWEVSMTLKEV